MNYLHIGVFENETGHYFVLVALYRAEVEHAIFCTNLELIDLEAVEEQLGHSMEMIQVFLKSFPTKKVAIVLHTANDANYRECATLSEMLSTSGIRSSPKLIAFSRQFIQSYFPDAE